MRWQIKHFFDLLFFALAQIKLGAGAYFGNEGQLCLSQRESFFWGRRVPKLQDPDLAIGGIYTRFACSNRGFLAKLVAKDFTLVSR